MHGRHMPDNLAVITPETAIKHIESYQPSGNDWQQRLDDYVQLLLSWNQKTNLIGRTTEEGIWQRHIIDSAQLFPFIPDAQSSVVTDFGSGAGLPGIILAILGVKHVHLAESNGKKIAFLKEAIQQLDLPVTLHHGRIEDMSPWKNDVVTARAFAPLPKLLSYVKPFMKKECLCLLLKGCSAKDEVRETAQKGWVYDAAFHPSISSTSSENRGYIVSLKQVEYKTV